MIKKKKETQMVGFYETSRVTLTYALNQNPSKYIRLKLLHDVTQIQESLTQEFKLTNNSPSSVSSD